MPTQDRNGLGSIPTPSFPCGYFLKINLPQFSFPFSQPIALAEIGLPTGNLSFQSLQIYNKPLSQWI